MTPALQVVQNPITPQIVSVTDVSTSISPSITKRRIYISDSSGTYLTGNGTVDYTEWSLSDLTISLSILTNSLAGNIRVDWLNVSNVVVETYNSNYPLSEFSKQFAYYLIQILALNPGTYMDSNYASNLGLLWTLIEAGDNAVTYGNDISGGQNCYNKAIDMQNNESKYF